MKRSTLCDSARTRLGAASAAAKAVDAAACNNRRRFIWWSPWEDAVREASEQSRRARLPEIGAAIALAEALKVEADYRYALEEAVAPPILPSLPAHRQPGHSVALLVGPEGGWTDREREQFAAAGWQPVSLGPHILRAETAAIAALAIINAAWM
jgi:16S rRNA (uracil1498-N3)-methyltransferase